MLGTSPETVASVGLVNIERMLQALGKAGLSPSRQLFHMSNTTEVVNELKIRFFPPSDTADLRSWDKERWPTWEAVGLFYTLQHRYAEAVAVFSTCYDMLLQTQEEKGFRIHKGKPLVLMSDAYWEAGWPVHSKRNVMLALCEDLITDKGEIVARRGSVYRSLWRHGMSNQSLQGIAKQILSSSACRKSLMHYPEAVLQSVEDAWQTENPSAKESGAFLVNPFFVRQLIANLGPGDGSGLEDLAHYLLSCMPGARCRRNVRSNDFEYDIICSINGIEQDFRSELGRYFICECKDWSRPVHLEALSKFALLLLSAKARFGILFSKFGVTGSAVGRFASREPLKIFQAHGVVIVTITLQDLERISGGANFIELLRDKYERVRLDMQ